MIVAKKSYNTLSYAGYDNYAYDYERYTEVDNKKANSEKSTKHKNVVKKKIKLMGAVTLMLLMGMLIVGRYALIMDLNNQSIDLKNKITENQKINDDLRLQLLKYSDITQIEEYATSDAKMVRPDINNIIHINVAKTNQGNKTAKQDEKPEKISFLGRLISFFE